MQNTIDGFVNAIVGYINMLIPLLISVIILLFFYHSGRGLFGDAQNAGNARAELRNTLIWGVVIVFIAVSIGGVLQLLGGSFNLIQSGF